MVVLNTSAAFAQLGVKINEVLVKSASVMVDNVVTEYIELYNTTPDPVDLGGASLTDTALNPQKYVFPPGVMISGNGYLLMRLSTNAPTASDTGFRLKSGGDDVYLYSKPDEFGFATQLDSVVFGFQVEDYSIGRIPDGGAWVLTDPTPRAANVAATLGDVFALRINEWLADASGGDPDAFEIYNGASRPVSLGGLYLADSGTIINPFAYFRIADLSFIGVGRSNAFIKFITKDPPTENDEVPFGLSRNSDAIYLLNSDQILIDSVIWTERQETDVSQGRIPDGGPTISSLPTPTLGKPNIGLITNVVINELLTHTDPETGLEDAIELYNLTDSPADISGFYLSEWRPAISGNNEAVNLKKYRIPNGTIVPAHGFKVFYEQVGKAGVIPHPGFNTSGTGDEPDFTYNAARGGIAYLTQYDANGNPAALVFQQFGPAENSVSFGRYTTSDGRVEFVAMSRRTFGRDNPTSVADFRLGKGLPNPSPKVGPVVINEIMYHPPDVVVPGASTNDNDLDEYIELRNITAASVRLYDPLTPRDRWSLSNAVNYVFPANITLAANAYLLVVGFDPATNLTQLAAFRAKYNLSTAVRIFGPWRGQLNNNNETIELYKPDPVQVPPHPDAGLVPAILVDKVRYNDSFPWPLGADGDGQSLQRLSSGLYGNDPINWKADAPTPGGINGFPPVITVQPEGGFVYAGEATTLSVVATGTPPLSYQWRLNDYEIPGATNPSITITNMRPANAGVYTVIVRNFVKTIVSTGAKVSSDFVKPVVSINSPTNNTQVTSETVTVRGKATDAVGIANVSVRVNGGDFQPVNGKTNWSLDVALVPGTNVILAQAIDVGKNLSLPVSVKVFYSVRSPLTLNITAGGTVSGASSGQLLEIGKGYTLSAKPNPGYLFAGWTGDIVSSNAILHFLMLSNMVLTAQFVPSPFIPVKGMYNGLFYVDGAVTPTNAGFFKLSLNDTGLFSGKLILGKATNSFSGQFGLNLRSQFMIPRAGSPLELDLYLDDQHGEISGSVISGWAAQLKAYLTGAFPQLAPYAGRYPWVIPGSEDAASSPGGDGAGSAVVNTAGVVQFTGTLGDGTPVSHSASLSRDGEFPLSVPLHGGQGILLGWINFYTNVVMSNPVTWIRPPLPTSRFYPAGFAGEKDFYASKYTKPVAGQNALTWTNGVVLIGAGNLSLPISNRVQVLNNVVSVLDGNANRIKVAISVTNGTFSGSFKHPITRTTNTLSGSLLQLAKWGGGWFKGTNQTGFISLEPIPPAVSITNPSSEATANACLSLTVSADALLNSGTSIARVTFYANGSSIGSDDTAPYEVSFVPGADETYFLTAVATDNLGSEGVSAAVTIHCQKINHAPSFTAGGDVTVTQNAGPYLSPWAQSMDDGESCYDQGLTFSLSNDNPNLFSVQPAINTLGFLGFTPADNASGEANVTVTLTDDGGTAGDGIDSSSATFRIVVTPSPPN
jgi:hypothetical protein